MEIYFDEQLKLTKQADYVFCVEKVKLNSLVNYVERKRSSSMSI